MKTEIREMPAGQPKWTVPASQRYLHNFRKAAGLFQLRGWWKAFQFQFGKPGGLRKIVRPYLDYYRPGFHPWDHDNRHFLEEIDQLAESYNAKANSAA